MFGFFIDTAENLGETLWKQAFASLPKRRKETSENRTGHINVSEHELPKKAEALTHFKGEELRNSEDSAKYWTKLLHQSFDGIPLRACTNAQGSTAWLGEGTTFLTGREFIVLVMFYISAMPTLTRLKRGQDVPVSCRAGCDARELLGHVLQQCHRTHHQRIQRQDGIVRYLATRLKEKWWRVKLEPHYRTSQGTRIPDIVIHRDHQSAILDVQVVGTRVALSEAHHMKRNK
ncbi:hypothetical protein MTO96_025104 [Rhipicephalus appendiculatus]